MQLVLLGLNHRTAPVDVRERFSLSKEEVNDALSHLYEYANISECVILSTCNRTEIYAVLEHVKDAKAFMLEALSGIKGQTLPREDVFYCKTGRACVDHLFRVSASLDSLVIGEGQILSQLKVAYMLAHEAGFTDTVFNILFQRAIRVGKLVRTCTGIANTPVSISYTAVNLAEDALEKPLSEAKVLILGAGQMSELTAIHLQAKGVKTMFVSNRTFAKAEELASRFGGHAITLDDFVEEAKTADILITSTGAPHYIVGLKEAEEIARGRQHNPIVMIDIAVPRDVAPEVAHMEGVYLFNIDALESVVERNKAQRLAEARKAEPIIEESVDEVLDKLSYLSVQPVMARLSDQANEIRKREVHRAMVKLPHLTDKDRRIMESMSRMIVRKLLREPMICLNEKAGTAQEEQYVQFVQDIFKMEREG